MFPVHSIGRSSKKSIMLKVHVRIFSLIWFCQPIVMEIKNDCVLKWFRLFVSDARATKWILADSHDRMR